MGNLCQGFSKAATGENNVYFPSDQFVSIYRTCGHRYWKSWCCS
uniref:Uncharacterized protein n=1 Tax=Arundo donax TaxID=35708 RepID=A0A0A9EC03_ARUDO